MVPVLRPQDLTGLPASYHSGEGGLCVPIIASFNLPQVARACNMPATISGLQCKIVHLGVRGKKTTISSVIVACPKPLIHAVAKAERGTDSFLSSPSFAFS